MVGKRGKVGLELSRVKAFDHLTDAAMEGDAVSSGEFIVERFSNEMVREAEPAGDGRNRIYDARIDGLLQEREQPDTRDVAHSPKRLQRELSSDHRCHRQDLIAVR